MIHFDIGGLESRLGELESKTYENGFWDDSKKSSSVLEEIKSIKSKCVRFKELKSDVKSVLEVIELIRLEYDEELGNDVARSIRRIEKGVEKFEVEVLLCGKYDRNNAILTLHPGAGGTEAQDWVEMLYRMYCRWANKVGFKVEELDFLEGDEAGIKSVTFEVFGENAYGYLKGEMGVHRLVRISPFDAGGRRHTSFASLEVLPEISDDVDLYINPDDVKMDVFRASGAGGQHINKTSSAVRLTHIPTGIVTSCQTQRSQLQNREYAMRMLKSKLLDLKEREHKETIDELKGVQRDIAWGSQIRSYVFCPYTLVKDHRTGFETGNIGAVMDGDLDGFIESYLKNSSNINEK